MLYTTMIMTSTMGVDLGFVLGRFLLIFYHIASIIDKHEAIGTGRLTNTAIPKEVRQEPSTIRKGVETSKVGFTHHQN